MQVPAPFEYERATSVEHALELLTQLGPEARLLAGGHSLLPMMKLRLASAGIPDRHRRTGRRARLHPRARGRGPDRRDDPPSGAARVRRCSREQLAIFTDAERVIADPVVRNRGTIGGALCQADPSEDLSAVCAALGARMVIRGPDGERIVEMREFYRGPYRTAVGADEMLIEIRVPLHERSGSAYEKVDRRVGDWAVAAAGAASPCSARRATIEARAGIALAAVGADVASRRGRASAARRQRRRRRSCSSSAEPRRGSGLQPRHRPARLGGVQATRRRLC